MKFNFKTYSICYFVFIILGKNLRETSKLTIKRSLSSCLSICITNSATSTTTRITTTTTTISYINVTSKACEDIPLDLTCPTIHQYIEITYANYGRLDNSSCLSSSDSSSHIAKRLFNMLTLYPTFKHAIIPWSAGWRNEVQFDTQFVLRSEGRQGRSRQARHQCRHWLPG